MENDQRGATQKKKKRQRTLIARLQPKQRRRMHGIDVRDETRNEEDVEQKMTGDTVTSKHRQLDDFYDIFSKRLGESV